MSTTITEVLTTQYEDPKRKPRAVVESLVAMGWGVEEETAEAVTLKHKLIPGATRIVHL